MRVEAVFVKWPKTMKRVTPYEVWVLTAKWFLRKKCLYMYVAVQMISAEKVYDENFKILPI